MLAEGWTNFFVQSPPLPGGGLCIRVSGLLSLASAARIPRAITATTNRIGAARDDNPVHDCPLTFKNTRRTLLCLDGRVMYVASPGRLCWNLPGTDCQRHVRATSNRSSPCPILIRVDWTVRAAELVNRT